jgi:hypothetical protein
LAFGKFILPGHFVRCGKCPCAITFFLPRRNTTEARQGRVLIVTAREDVNAVMQKTEQPAFPPAADFHSSKSIIAALARAETLLKAGDLADATKWAAVAASLRGAQSLPETA